MRHHLWAKVWYQHRVSAPSPSAAITHQSSKKTCQSYSTRFFSAAKEAAEAGDEEAREAFAVLGSITSMALKADSREEPFTPLVVFNTGRSAILEDFSADDLEVLREVVGEVSDPELKARIADVVWCKKRDHLMAQLAVTSYLESAHNLRSANDWLTELSRIERAFALTAELGSPDELYSEVVEYTEAAVRVYENVRFDRPRARFLEFLQKYRAEDTERYSSLAEEGAAKAEANRWWAEARHYWRMVSRWREMVGDSEGRRNALVRSAETYVAEAEEELAKASPSYITVCSHLERAIEGLRRAGKTRARVAEVHEKLLEYQVRTRDEMASFTHEMDLSKPAEQAKEHVKAKPLGEAMLALVYGCSPPTKAYLRQQVEEISKDSIWALVERSVVDEKGKVVARKSSPTSGNPEVAQTAFRAEMLSQANDYRQTNAVAFIHPALRQITLEHNIQMRDLLPLLADNPFVPEGRESIYARGLLAGFQWDFLTAAHLLVPQLENSIRHVLATSGVIVSKLDDRSVQEDKYLGELLYEPRLEELFGEDLVFDLQGLLVERVGSNLRNKLAHGLMNNDEFSSFFVLYLWWVVLRICLLYFVMISKRAESGNGEVD
jgi:hypothetical protein